MERFLITEVEPAYFPNYLRCKVINTDTEETDCIFVFANPHLVSYTFAQFGAKENKYLYYSAYLYGCTIKENQICIHKNSTKSFKLHSIDKSIIYIELEEMIEPNSEKTNKNVIEEIVCLCSDRYLSNSRFPKYLWSEFKDMNSGKHKVIMFNADTDICIHLARLRQNDEYFPDSYFMGALDLKTPELRIDEYGQFFREYQLVKSLTSYDFYFEKEENKFIKLSYIRNEFQEEYLENDPQNEDDFPF